MNTLVAVAKPVIDVVQIGNIRLLHSNLGTKVRAPSEVPEPDISLNYETEVQSRDANSFFVVVGFTLSVVSEAEEPQESGSGAAEQEDNPPAVWVNAAFEIAYNLPEEAEFDEDALDAFATVNGAFNAWPYFREYLQNSMARMALPQIRLGLYKVPSPGDEEGHAEASSTQQREDDNHEEPVSDRPEAQ